MEKGQWFTDPLGCLYIVGEDGVEGPDHIIVVYYNEDNERVEWVEPKYLTDVINNLLREGMQEALNQAQLDLLGLTEVPAILKRWTPEEGFYHA